jgi:hypothetical protein
MEKSLKLFVAAVGIALAYDMPALADDGAARAVPFFATYVGSVKMTAPTACPDKPTFCSSATISADGVSTQLGRSRYTALHALHLAEAGCWAYPYTEDTLTAADGDSLVMSMDGLACPTESPGAFDAVGSWHVVRGTGRFAGVTGQGTFDGHPNVITEHGSVTLEGWLSIPNQ